MDRLDDDPDYQLPEVGWLGYLVDYLSEIGEAQASGTGIVALSWRDLSAWALLTGIRLSPVEYKALRTLSRAYVAEYYRSDGKDALAPVIIEANQERVEKKLNSLFAMMRG